MSADTTERDKAIEELIAAAAAWSPMWRKITEPKYREYLVAGDRLAAAIEKLTDGPSAV
jgi:hypothetical protein